MSGNAASPPAQQPGNKPQNQQGQRQPDRQAQPTVPTRAERPVYRFRVRSGTWWQPTSVIDEDTKEPVKDRDGKPVYRDVPVGPSRPAGDIAVSTQRLDRLHNKGGNTMFELLDQNDDPRVGQIQRAEQARDAADARYRRALGKMTQRELLDHAEQEGIDLKGEMDEVRVRNMLLAAAGMDPNPDAVRPRRGDE